MKIEPLYSTLFKWSYLLFSKLKLLLFLKSKISRIFSIYLRNASRYLWNWSYVRQALSLRTHRGYCLRCSKWKICGYKFFAGIPRFLHFWQVPFVYFTPFFSLLIFEYWEFLFMLRDGSLNRRNSPEHSSLSHLNYAYVLFHVNLINLFNNQKQSFCWIICLKGRKRIRVLIFFFKGTSDINNSEKTNKKTISIKVLLIQSFSFWTEG